MLHLGFRSDIFIIRMSVEKVMEAMKTLPLNLYQLALINLILFVGLVVKELTLLYMLGSLVFVIMVLSLLCTLTGAMESPTFLISEEVSYRLNEIRDEAVNWLKKRQLTSEIQSNKNLFVKVNFLLP